MTPSPDIPEKEIRERCSEILSAAAEEARKLDHNYIGVEHLFMALTRNDKGLTTLLIKKAGLDPRFVRNEIRKEIGTGDAKVGDVLPPLQCLLGYEAALTHLPVCPPALRRQDAHAAGSRLSTAQGRPFQAGVVPR